MPPLPALGALTFRNRVVLAPMSGVTDVEFRRLAARCGAGLVVSEMVASEELVRGSEEARLRAEGEGVSPHVVQIAGREPHWMAEAARLAESAGADAIDINMGCPAKRVTTGLSGSALMRDLELATDLIEATVGAVGVPVSVKMRLGWDETSLNAPELARRAELSGARLVTVHGRTRCQFYKGRADWAAIRAVRQATALPLVVNGDIAGIADARAALDASGADAVMIGRAAIGRPWLMGQVAAALEGRAALPDPEPAEIHDAAADHFEGLVRRMGSVAGTRHARKHLAAYMDQFPANDGQASRLAALRSDDPAAVLLFLRTYFTSEPARRAA